MPYIPGFSAYVLFFLCGFLIWMIVDCLQTKRISWKQKLLWLLVLIFFEPFGMFIYFFVALVGRFLMRKPNKPIGTGLYGNYEQGYEGVRQQSVQQFDKVYSEDDWHELSTLSQYEQPQARYPEQG